jgi:hypothetical protein
MKSNKQRRTELRELRQKRQEKHKAKAIALEQDKVRKNMPANAVRCNPEALAPSSSYYTVLPFVDRGYYIDLPFQCVDCQKQEIWTAAQQQWWYEVAKGNVLSFAVRCRACRHMERDRKIEARRIHLEGVAKKLAMTSTIPE